MELFAYITWNVDRVLVEFGPVTIRWYGLLFAVAFLLSFSVMRWVFRRENKPVEELYNLMVYLLIGTLVGARLGHCLIYEPDIYLRKPLLILEFWQGGLASHGAAIGILFTTFIFARRKRNKGFSYPWLVDRLALAVALTACCVRLGNLMNSEIIGNATDVPWAFIFQRVDPIPRHPAQLYEAITYAILFVLLLGVYRWRYPRTRRMLLVGILFVVMFGARFFLEYTKTRQASYGHDFPLSLGQILSLPMVLIGILLFFCKPKPAPEAETPLVPETQKSRRRNGKRK